MRSTTATQPGSPRRPRRCCTLGTEVVHFFLFDQNSEFTLIAPGSSRHGDTTLEPDFSVSNLVLHKRRPPIRQA